MPAFTETHPRETWKVQGMDLSLPNIFAEGHTVTEGEAKWMNSNLASVIGNAYGGDVRRAVAALDKARTDAFKAKKYTGPMTADGKKPAPATVADLGWDHQAKIETKFTNYQLGVPHRRGGTPKDPTDDVANRIAVAFVKDYLKRKGASVKKFIDRKNEEHGNEFNRLVSEYLAAKHDDIYAQARAQVEAMSKANEGEVELNLAA